MNIQKITRQNGARMIWRRMQQRLKGRDGGKRAVNFCKLLGSLKLYVKSASWEWDRLDLSVASKQLSNMSRSQALDATTHTWPRLHDRIRRTGTFPLGRIESRDFKDSEAAIWHSSLKEYEGRWDFAKLNDTLSPRRDESWRPDSGVILELKATEWKWDERFGGRNLRETLNPHRFRQSWQANLK